jgi:hypothetical protein
MDFRLLLLIGVVVVLASLLVGAPGTPTTVASVSLCELLAHPDQFDGRTVRLRANYSGTWEGYYLTDTACTALHAQGEGIVYVAGTNDLTLPRHLSVEFVNDDGAREFAVAAKSICNGMNETHYVAGKVESCQYDYVTADFVGLIVVKKGFRVRDGFGNGFGHLRMRKIASS